MRRATEQVPTTDAGEVGIGVAGRTALSMMVAGGVLSSGFLLGGLALTGHVRSSSLMLFGTMLYVTGAVLGFVHGGVLGYLGREPGATPATARRQLARALLYAPVPAAAGWAASGWIAMTAGSLLLGNPWLLFGTGFAMAAGVFAVGLAARFAARALANAYARWPERVAGTAIVAAAFVLLLLAFRGVPAAAFGGIAPTGLGAILAAGALAVWVVGPAATVGLRHRHGRDG